MAHTPEQRAAYDRLAEAVQAVMEIVGYAGPDQPPMVTTDFVVLVAQQGYDADGESASAIAWLLRDGEMPWYRIIGVVRAGLTRIEHLYNEAEDT